MLLALSVLSGLTAAASFGASCGTVASPTSCSITVGGTNIFTVSNFNLVNAGGSGGGQTYTGEDIAIDIGSGGGLSMVLTFSHNEAGPSSGTVFFNNAGQASNFTFSYDLELTTAVPGTASLIDPLTVALGLSSFAGNGQSAVQLSTSGVQGLCQATTVTTSDTCNLPLVLSNPLSFGNIVSMSGNAGNTSIGTFTNLFQSDFTADQGSGVPEPSTFALLGLGLGAAAIARYRRQ
jgi:hypothetical protein